MAVTQSTWTPELDQQLTDLHAQGLSLRECATRIGRSRSGVGDHAKALGLIWDRAQTKAATEARVADCEARRAGLELKFLVKADEALDRTDKPHTVWAFTGPDGGIRKHTMPLPPSSAVKDYVLAAAQATRASMAINDHDTDTSENLAAVDQWLTHMTESETPREG